MYEELLILRLCAINLWISFIKPSIKVFVTSFLILYLPCSLLVSRISSLALVLMLEVILLAISYTASACYFSDAYKHARIYNGSVYMNSTARLKQIFKTYYKWLSVFTRYFEFCNVHEISPIVGVLVNFLMFKIHSPFCVDLFNWGWLNAGN